MKLIIRFAIALLALTGLLVFYASGPKNAKVDFQYIVNTNSEVIQHKTDTFSVITFNIGYLSGMTNNLPIERSSQLFEDNLERTSKLIETYQPDIVCFQEIDFDADRSFNVDQMTYLLEYTDLVNAAIAINWNVSYVPFPYWPIDAHFGGMLSGQAVASKYPIVTNERIVLQRPESTFFIYDLFYLDRLIQLCTIKIGNRDLVVINVHLEAWDKEVRLKQAKVVAEYYKRLSGKFPVLLLGDFNDSPDSPIYKILLSVGNIVDSSLAKNDNITDQIDYYTFKSADPNIKIDYIFYKNNGSLLIDDSYIVIDEPYSGNLYCSDHLGVKTIFKSDP